MKKIQQLSEFIDTSFPPFFDPSSDILILGSFPSVKSRETGFYYGHPQNRFWKVLAVVYSENIPQTIDEKKQLLKRHNIALWDVVSSCEIQGSSDSSIKNVKPSDLNIIFSQCKIRHIYTGGNKAGQLYRKYLKPVTGRDAVVLPSTSPANAAWTLDKLVEAWKIIKDV
ncbi:MAG: DNA-deoxyinosine glycosylase [Oscillospiraceae bacterium]|nr:DNA-deoxyinosine glycosylase [Oscillospiraceae bacterium]